MSEDPATAAARLAEVLAAENAALAALDFPRATALLAAKTQAADTFAVACAAWPAPKEVAVQLAELAGENRRLLQRAMTAQGRVIEVIARAVPRALQETALRYGAKGKVAAPRPRPITLSARA